MVVPNGLTLSPTALKEMKERFKRAHEYEANRQAEIKRNVISANTKLAVRREDREFGLLLPDGSQVWEQPLSDNPSDYDYNELAVNLNKWYDTIDDNKPTFFMELRGDNSSVENVEAALQAEGFKAYVLTRTRFTYEYETEAAVHIPTIVGPISKPLSDLIAIEEYQGNTFQSTTYKWKSEEKD